MEDLLTINVGSSSVRLVQYMYDGSMLRRFKEAHFSGDVDPQNILCTKKDFQNVDVLAHRVVYGGAQFDIPRIIDHAVEAEIEHLSLLAPLHNSRALKWIRECRKIYGTHIKQIAVFDTGFYTHLPKAATIYALPQKLSTLHGLRRYGFHGIAHQALWQRWSVHHPEKEKQGRIISLQLGSGCSITATTGGVPRDTSMGFSPLEGLVMSTRAGDLDPGVLLYLIRESGMSAEELNVLLNQESGLYGLAGSSDMRVLLASTDPAARVAVNLYCYRARKYIGAYLAVLGGVDAILFGGGVGENAATIRESILTGLEWAGIKLDTSENKLTKEGERCISSSESKVEIWVIPVDESLVLAESAVKVLGNTDAAVQI